MERGDSETVFDGRAERQRKKFRLKYLEEIRRETEAIRSRPDYFQELDYFVDLLESGPDPAAISARTGLPVAGLLCVQAPFELVRAAGFHPFRICGGSAAAARLSAPQLPPVMCPALRSIVGAALLEPAGGKGFALRIAPCTCDWTAKMPELEGLVGSGGAPAFYRMDLPRLKDRDESQERWLGEVYALRRRLMEAAGGKRVGPPALSKALAVYQGAWRAFSNLSGLRAKGHVASAVFAAVAASFFHDLPETWTERLKRALPLFKASAQDGLEVFLAGSPVFFPNFKLYRLLEEAGLRVAGDDLCSGERIFPGAVFCDDPSEHGLLKALAQRYHQGCLCPVFAEDDRRANSVVAPALDGRHSGVVYHVLKGCHPYDLESIGLERRVKEAGMRFLRIETDYAEEDSQTLLTRLEAFRNSLVPARRVASVG
ncbi:MAG: 2-hydroxyacyl-CoA dehydratase family protein [Deltaproteobacteria bacterium]|jgi:benzoyl-CoA reductase/2-hydroxyglutaryl-CoA dehydratase subunit BcrC/BadD/HgdB|nr:2-hydroxyacyl-CoA dehydratase family protein [Deltaproteobacteria bacterium]